MKINKITYYVVICALVFIAKLAYSQATNDALLFILKPLSIVISFVLGNDFSYSVDAGFYFESLNFTIDKSCSGINFWIISFAMFSVSILKVIRSNFQRFLIILVLILITYLFTLFANASRILTAIFISNQTKVNYTWLHQAEGVFIYLSLLILAYTIFNYIISKFNNQHEKLT